MKAHIESIKLGLQTLVYLALLALIVSLFFKPEFTAKRTGDFFKAFQDHDINIKIAALGFNISPREVKELTAQSSTLDQVKLSASCLASRDCSGAQQAELASLLELEQVGLYLSKTEWPKVAEPSVVVPDPNNTEPGAAPVIIVEERVPEFGDWVVVLGADRSLEAALDEQQKIAARAPLNEIELINRDGFFRTVAFFDSRAAADAALPVLELAARRKGIYARATTIWCEGEMARGADGVISCG